METETRRVPVVKVTARVPAFQWQMDFIEELLNGAQYPGMFGGFGSGKTRADIMAALALAKRYPARMGAIYEPSYPVVTDTLIPEIEEFCDNYRVRYRIVGGSLPIWYIEAHKVKVLLRSMERPRRIVGANLAWALVDELDTLRLQDCKLAWTKITARVRKSDRQPVGVTTTPEGFHFCHSLWGGNNDPGVFRALHVDARRNHTLGPRYFQERLAGYTEAMLEAYVKGEFTNLVGGRPYYSYDRKLQAAKRVLYKPGYPLEFSFDYNVHPMTCFVSQTEGDLLRGVDDIMIQGSNTHEMCEEIINRYGDHRNLVYCYGDATGKRKQTSSRGYSDHRIVLEVLRHHYARQGVKVVNKFTSHNPFVRDRIQSVNAKFKNHRGQVSFVLDPVNCQYTNHEFETIAYKEGTGIIETLGETVGHITSAVGYRVWIDWPVIKQLKKSLRKEAA